MVIVSAQHYNSLIDIAEANDLLSSCGGRESLEELLRIICDAGLSDVLGIRLLHRHSEIAEGEIMLAAAQRQGHDIAIVTRPEACDGLSHSDARPNSWQLVGAHFFPIEFSAAWLVQDVNESDIRVSRCFDGLARVLKQRHLDKLLGPCVRESNLVRECGLPGEILVETCDLPSRSNIQRFSVPDATNTIETVWIAPNRTATPELQPVGACFVYPEGGHSGALTKPDKKPVVPEAACSCFVYPEGGHSGSHTKT